MMDLFFCVDKYSVIGLSVIILGSVYWEVMENKELIILKNVINYML